MGTTVSFCIEAALWAKLGVIRKVKKREIRILSDKAGQSNGRVHTDQAGGALNKHSTYDESLPPLPCVL